MPRNSKDRRSVCPVACTLDLVGDKWTLLVVRDLLCGRSHFQEFMQSPERIASNILADRLERLVRGELVETVPSPKRADGFAYRLTPRGRTLEPLLEMMKQWGLANLPGTAVHVKPEGTERARAGNE